MGHTGSMAKVSAHEKAAGGPPKGWCWASVFAQSPIPGLLPPECCNYGSVTTLDWVLLADRTRLNLSLSPVPSAEPGKTRDAWSMLAE